MQRDIRDTAVYHEVDAFYRALRQPGTGQISEAVEVHVSPDGRHVVFAGTLMERLEGVPPTRICVTDLSTGDTRVLTFGPNIDRLPKFSPDGGLIAFLSDRHKAGDYQLYLLDPKTGAARSTPAVEGWVEYLHWSPDGRRILLGVAGHGADISGGQGAVTSKRDAKEVPSWIPEVEAGDAAYRWRRAWVYELATDRASEVSHRDTNVWEAVWCGDGNLAAVVSPDPGEGLWYSARLVVIETATGNSHEVYTPQNQLGWPAASPSGKRLALVEALCSDRGIVAGELRLIDPTSGNVQRVDTRGVDITYTEWRSDQELLLAGHRGFESVVGVYDATVGTFTEVWSSRDVTSAGRYMAVSGLGAMGDCVLVGESFTRAPEIALICRGTYRAIKSFDHGYADQAETMEVERVTWEAQDGLEIQGWILRPKGDGPFPLVMNVHGGPVWHWRPVWLGRGGVPFLMLAKRGYAIFFPNPRGSTGRGQDFVRHVYGDLGGADAQDLLSGLDALIERGLADPRRLGVTGGSYGGFMTSWLIGQSSRFAAAAPVAPHTNQVTEHLLSNIPHFVALFLADKYNNPGGKYFERSPIMHAHKVTTPALNICGALDRCTPPEEALQFHNALLENGVKSVLVTYPEEGHGVRNFPATIDYAARIVSWFEERLSPAHQNVRSNSGDT
jgi:dipeptidyl aminopeptidase/acylaminoacyl peptidase